MADGSNLAAEPDASAPAVTAEEPAAAEEPQAEEGAPPVEETEQRTVGEEAQPEEAAAGDQPEDATAEEEAAVKEAVADDATPEPTASQNDFSPGDDEAALAATRVQANIRGRQARAALDAKGEGMAAAAAPPQHLDAGQELGNREGLGEVVVAARPQSSDPVVHLPQRRQDQRAVADRFVARYANVTPQRS